MEEINYEQDMYIDDSALDIELLNQPSLMLKYTSALSRARRNLDRLKEKLNMVKADLDKEIRSDPESFDLGKITEAAVANCILAQPEYEKVIQEYINAQYEVNMTQGAVNAVQQRKDVLEAMVKLLGMNYFAGPKLPREINYQSQKKLENQEQNKRMAFARKRG